MNLWPGSARILVATENADDARHILRQLSNDFEHVGSSTGPALMVQDFEDHRPDVLVLAVDSLDKAQRWCLAPFRGWRCASGRPVAE